MFEEEMKFANNLLTAHQLFEYFLCDLHEVYSRTMLRPDLFIYLFIYLFVYERRAPVTWSSVYGAIVLLVRVIFSSDRITS